MTRFALPSTSVLVVSTIISAAIIIAGPSAAWSQALAPEPRSELGAELGAEVGAALGTAVPNTTDITDADESAADNTLQDVHGTGSESEPSLDDAAWDTDELDEIAGLDLADLLSRKVVTESRAEESLDEVISTLRVISRDEILLYGYRDLPDVLKHTLGVDYIQPASWMNGGFRGRPGTWVDVKFLIDGHEVNLLWSGEAFLSNQYLLNNVDRVEILYGPASSVYGADAMSGVVNVITRKPPEFGATTSAYVSGSSQGRKEVGFTGSVTRQRMRLSFSSAFMQMQGPDFSDFVLSPGYDANSNARQMNFDAGVDGYHDNNEGHRVQADLEADIAAGQTLILGGFWLKNVDGKGMESRNNLLNSEDTHQRQLGLRMAYEADLRQIGAGSVPTTVRATYQYTIDAVQFNWTRGYPEAGFLNVWNVEDSSRHIVSLFSTTEFADLRNRLIVGTEYERLRIAPIHFTGRTLDDALPLADGSEIAVVGRVLFPANDDSFSFLSESLEQTIASAFIQDEQRIGKRAKLVLGGRFDRSNQYGNLFNIRSGMRWSPFTWLAGRASYNEAFLSPSIFDLASGQGALKPMRLRTGEVGLQSMLAGKLMFQVNGFWNYLSDIIVDGDDITQYTRINRGSETTLGAEAEVRWHSGPLSGYFGLAYVKDDEGNTPMDAAALKMIARLSWNAWKNLYLAVDSKYTSPITTLREDPNNLDMIIEHRIDRYKLVNLSLTGREFEISPTSTVTVSATLRNVFNFENHFPNQRAPTPYTFIEEPRSFFIKAEVNL